MKSESVFAFALEKDSYVEKNELNIKDEAIHTVKKSNTDSLSNIL